MRSLSQWVMRCLCLHRFDGNPLRRRSDRIETVVVLAGLMIFIAALWPAVALGRQAYQNGLRAELTGPGHRQAVAAEVVDPARGAGWQARTVRWTTPEGGPRTGKVVLPPRCRLDHRAWQGSVPRSHRHDELLRIFLLSPRS